MPFVRTSSGRMLDGEEVFKLWVEMGSTVKVTRHYNREGFKNSRTGRPISQMTVWMSAMRWVIENPEKARPYYIAAGAYSDDDDWAIFLISKAPQVLKSKKRFIHWAKQNGLFEKYFYHFASRFSLTEKDLEYYRDNPVDIQ